MSENDQFLGKLGQLAIWKDGTVQRRAPHKPLLLLLYLGAVQQGKERLLPYVEVEAKLAAALEKFGPQRKQCHPEYPFWALTNDGICEVKYRGILVKKKGENKPTRSSLINSQAAGGFVTKYYFLLREDRDLQASVAHYLMDAHFPVSLHEDLLAFFGLQLPAPRPGLRSHGVDLGLRELVLKAYDHRCAFSGFSVGTANWTGLEIAFFCWRQVGGVSAAANAIPMTTTLRKLFDLGVLGVDDDYHVMVTKEVLDHPHTSSHVKDLNGKKLTLPKLPNSAPSLANVRWHRREVFKG